MVFLGTSLISSSKEMLEQTTLLARAERLCDDFAGRFDSLTRLAAQLGIKRAYLGGGLVLGALLFLFVGVGAQLFSSLVGFAFPAYASFKAIESPGKDDDTQWLTYWVVFAVFSLLEVFADTLRADCRAAPREKRMRRARTARPRALARSRCGALTALSPLSQLLWWFPLYYVRSARAREPPNASERIGVGSDGASASERVRRPHQVVLSATRLRALCARLRASAAPSPPARPARRRARSASCCGASCPRHAVPSSCTGASCGRSSSRACPRSTTSSRSRAR